MQYGDFYIHTTHIAADEHLGCFHILTIATMLLWILGCIYLFEVVFLFFSNIYSEVGLLDHMVDTILVLFCFALF